jgi:hypothetical protein
VPLQGRPGSIPGPGTKGERRVPGKHRRWLPTRARASTLLLIALAHAACATHGAAVIAAPTAWSAVQSLPPESRVRVNLRWNDSVVGSIVSVDAERIHITGRAAANGVARTDVTKVYLREGRQTAKHRKRGALIGLSVGALAIASDQGSFGVLMAALWTGLGAGVGAAAGYLTPNETLVYAAPTR